MTGTMGLACDRRVYDLRFKTCERYSRNHGGVSKLLCAICRRGPCEHDAYKVASDVPNRLYGATITPEGDAI